MARFVNMQKNRRRLTPPDSTTTGKEGGNLGYVDNPVPFRTNRGSDVDMSREDNAAKSMDAVVKQNTGKIQSLNEQKRDVEQGNIPGLEGFAEGGVVDEDKKINTSEQYNRETIFDEDGNPVAVTDEPSTVDAKKGDIVVDTSGGRNPNYVGVPNPELDGFVKPQQYEARQETANPIYGSAGMTGGDMSDYMTNTDTELNMPAPVQTTEEITEVKPDPKNATDISDFVKKYKDALKAEDEEYQKKLTRSRMFQALHKGLSALSQLPGAKNKSNAPLKEDDTIWKAYETELGNRWKANRADISNTFNNEMALRRQNMNNEYNLAKLAEQIRNNDRNYELKANESEAKINRWNAMTDYQKAQIGILDLEKEYKSAQVAVQEATVALRNAQTKAAKDNAAANLMRAYAYRSNVSDMIKKRPYGGKNNKVTQIEGVRKVKEHNAPKDEWGNATGISSDEDVYYTTDNEKFTSLEGANKHQEELNGAYDPSQSYGEGVDEFDPNKQY